MATNKEWIVNLEASLGALQDNLNRRETSVSDKLQQLESTLSKVYDFLFTRQDLVSCNGKEYSRSSNGHFCEATDTGKPLFSSQ